MKDMELQEKTSKKSSMITQNFYNHLSAYTYIAPFFIVFGIFTLFPVLWSAYISFFHWNILGHKEFIGLRNYIQLFTDDPKFWKSVGNTFSIWIISTVPQLFMALVLSNLLNQGFLKGRKWFRLGVIIPNITSLVAVAIVFGSFFGPNYGLINYFLTQFGLDKVDWSSSYWASQFAVSAMVIWRWMGYNSIIYLAALQSIPDDLYEAARLDGASKIQQFFQITIPMIRPMILFTIIMSTIGGMQLFIEPLIFLGPQGGTSGQGLTMVLYLYTEAFTNSNFGYASAIAWMLFIIIVIFSAFNSYLTKKIDSAQ
jgi:cellobiose transport system permease protein